MSEKEKDIFKDLFQKEFSNHKESVEEENWDLIAARLEKKRFFKFSVSRFNIYYSLLTFTMFSISIFALTVWLNNQGYLNFNSTINKADTTQAPINKTILSPSKEEKKGSGDSEKSTSSFKPNSQTTKSTASNNIDTIVHQTNIPPSKTDTVSSASMKESIRPVLKKTIYVIKQDTVIKIDTLRDTVSKRKKKK